MSTDLREGQFARRPPSIADALFAIATLSRAGAAKAPVVELCASGVVSPSGMAMRLREVHPLKTKP